MAERIERSELAALFAASVSGERDALWSSVEAVVGLGTWVWDVRSGAVAWSPQLYRILGYDPARDDASAERFHAVVHPDDRARVQEVSRSIAQTGEAQTTRCRVVRANGRGEVRHVQLDAVAIRDESGTLLRLLGTVLDMTERMARERELARTATLLNEAQQIAGVGSWYWEPERRRIEWSEELYRILGVDRAVTPSEQLFFDLVHPEDRPRLRLGRDPVVNRGAGHTEFRVVTPGGEVKRVLMQARTIERDPRHERGHEPEPGGPVMLGTILDITARKALEEELIRAQKLEVLGRLAGGIAHDFNNLLTVISTNAELLRGRPDGAEVEDILRATERGAALTKQLVALARNRPTHVVPIDPNEGLRTAIALARRVLGEQVVIRTELAVGVAPVLGDAVQFEQVVMNLLLNARDAMPSGGTVVVTTENARVGAGDEELGVPPGDYVLIRVKDSGVGMNDDTAARAFEPFFTTKPVGRGMGLGLANVLGIVTEAGGAVRVHSRPGAGTTFSIYWPRAERPAETSPEPPHHERPVARGTVLVVEDEAMVRGAVCELLRTKGFEVVACERPLLALEAARAQKFDLLLTDVVMPDLSGRELAKRLYDEGRIESVLFMTGYAPASDDADDPPNARYVHKPFTAAELSTAIREALAR